MDSSVVSDADLWPGGSMDRLAENLLAFWSDDQRWTVCSKSIRAYAESQHSLEGRISELEAVLRKVPRQNWLESRCPRAKKANHGKSQHPIEVPMTSKGCTSFFVW